MNQSLCHKKFYRFFIEGLKVEIVYYLSQKFEGLKWYNNYNLGAISEIYFYIKQESNINLKNDSNNNKQYQ